MIGGMSDLMIHDWEPIPLCRDCEYELGACNCLPDPPDPRVA